MKRIGGLKQQLGAGLREVTSDGRTPLQQIEEFHGFIRNLEGQKYALLQQVLELLKEDGITISSVKDLSVREKKTQKTFCREYLSNTEAVLFL